VKPGTVVVFGASHTRGPKSAYLARFDGHSLALMTPPPTENVTSYVEDGAGVQWAVSSESDTPWRREPGREWHAVPLPLHYQPDELWLANGSDVWVRADGPIIGEGADRQVRGNVALFATHGVDQVQTFGGGPVPEDDGP
jgi:hypothetical protein